jgi:hypothetical protein
VVRFLLERPHWGDMPLPGRLVLRHVAVAAKRSHTWPHAEPFPLETLRLLQKGRLGDAGWALAAAALLCVCTGVHHVLGVIDGLEGALREQEEAEARSASPPRISRSVSCSYKFTINPNHSPMVSTVDVR